MNRTMLKASEETIAIRSLSDIADALGRCFDADGLILTEHDVAPEFFDLSTGWAGELFQKFINYQKRLVFIVADPEAHGQRFSELAYEHRTHATIRIVQSEADIQDWR